MAVRQRTGIEVAHLTSGKNLDGNTLGIAWQPGAWSLSQQALFWIGGGGLFGGGPNLSFQNMMVAAHELGHNFTGDHGAAEEICVAHFIFCWDYERTIMWPTYYSDNRDEFSDANDTRIKTDAATGRNVNYVHS
jgi:Metallo-peptidase family M12